MELHLLVDVFRNSILITGLVLIMMLLIEYFNVYSHGRWYSALQGSSFKQVILGALLGIVPGCVGGFAAVSLYTHRLLTFGALVTMMICSSGDEAFVMLAMIPKEALILCGIVLVLGIVVGLLVDKIKFFRTLSESSQCSGHGHDHHGHLIGHDCSCHCGDEITLHSEDEQSMPSIFKASSYNAMKHPGVKRMIIFVGIAIFLALVGGGLLEHDHEAHMHSHEHGTEVCAHGHGTEACAHDHGAAACAHEHETACEHDHGHEHGHSHSLNLLEERWIHLVFAIFSVITLFFTATASEHFINEHIWEHVVKKHALSVFCWTFGALLVCELGIHYLDLEHLISENMLWVMILAALIGIIPESGPHLIFVTLFAGGLAPFYILLVNSIVQDGHATIPLLAQSRKSFIWAKLVNVVVGLAVGFVFWFLA
ncbi:MAG: hypothetical protein MJY76_02830 [Bacteroidales bacterium]|nr:hypothetical protein [Bacteroidales bacterium]